MTQILKPLKHGNVLTEEEVLKDIGDCPTSLPPSDQGTEASSDNSEGDDLENYGLIYTRLNHTLNTKLEGEEGKEVPFSFASGGLTYQNGSLYFVVGSKVRRWPEDEEYEFGKKVIYINHYHGKIFVTLEDRICNLQNRTMFRADKARHATFYFGELYYISSERKLRRGALNKSRWPGADVESLAAITVVGDTLFTCDRYKKIQSHKITGESEIIYDEFPRDVNTMYGIRDKKGIRIFYGHDWGISSFYVHDTYHVESTVHAPYSCTKDITVAPIEFIERLNKGFK